MNDSRVIVALDDMTYSEAYELNEKVRSEAGGAKVGFELVTVFGASEIASNIGSDTRLFIDVKLYDIPSTVAKAVKRLMKLGVWMINMHISGGPEMMIAARKAVDEVWKNRHAMATDLTVKPLLIGVTVLTSFDYDNLMKFWVPVQYGFGGTPGNPVPIVLSDAEKAERIRKICIDMAISAKECGLNGVVTSPQEASYIRAAVPDPEFEIVTPGIRSDDDVKDDQVRVATAAGAIDAGATWLVVGRPITKAKDPLAELRKINQQVREVRVQKGAVLA